MPRGWQAVDCKFKQNYSQCYKTDIINHPGQIPVSEWDYTQPADVS